MTNYCAIEHPSEPNYLDIFSAKTKALRRTTPPGEISPRRLISATNSSPVWTSHQRKSDLSAVTRRACRASDGTGAMPANTPSSTTLGRFQHFRSGPRVHPTCPFRALIRHPPHGRLQQTAPRFICGPQSLQRLHDCSVATGDHMLAKNIEGYRVWAMTHNSLLIVVWDEDDSSQSNKLPPYLLGRWSSKASSPTTTAPRCSAVPMGPAIMCCCGRLRICMVFLTQATPPMSARFRTSGRLRRPAAHGFHHRARSRQHRVRLGRADLGQRLG